MWKGDGVGCGKLHEWVNNHKPKPGLCEICHSKPPYDLANVTGNYTRDFSNWKYFCRSCHMKSDGRMNNLSRSLPGKLNPMYGRKRTKISSYSIRMTLLKAIGEVWTD